MHSKENVFKCVTYFIDSARDFFVYETEVNKTVTFQHFLSQQIFIIERQCQQIKVPYKYKSVYQEIRL